VPTVAVPKKLPCQKVLPKTIQPRDAACVRQIRAGGLRGPRAVRRVPEGAPPTGPLAAQRREAAPRTGRRHPQMLTANARSEAQSNWDRDYKLGFEVRVRSISVTEPAAPPPSLLPIVWSVTVTNEYVGACSFYKALPEKSRKHTDVRNLEDLCRSNFGTHILPPPLCMYDAM